MSIRQGLIQGLLQGLKQNINYWEVSAETIYDQEFSADIESFIQAALGSADDYDIMDIAPYAMNDLVGGFVNNNANNPLIAQGGATDVASPHGRAIIDDGATKYWIVGDTGNGDFTVGTAPFAFAVRVKITGSAPASDTFFISKGSAFGGMPGENGYWGFGLDSSGKVYFRAKVSGGAATSANSNVVIADGNWYWILGGRSITNSKVWIRLTSGSANTAFNAANNLNNIDVPFGVYNALAGDGGVACQIDHIIMWTGTAAENVYTNQFALIESVFND